MSRKYTKLDLIRFHNFRVERPELKPTEALRAYDVVYPELTSAEKLANALKFFEKARIQGVIEHIELNGHIEMQDVRALSELDVPILTYLTQRGTIELDAVVDLVKNKKIKYEQIKEFLNEQICED